MPDELAERNAKKKRRGKGPLLFFCMVQPALVDAVVFEFDDDFGGKRTVAGVLERAEVVGIDTPVVELPVFGELELETHAGDLLDEVGGDAVVFEIDDLGDEFGGEFLGRLGGSGRLGSQLVGDRLGGGEEGGDIVGVDAMVAKLLEDLSRGAETVAGETFQEVGVAALLAEADPIGGGGVLQTEFAGDGDEIGRDAMVFQLDEVCGGPEDAFQAVTAQELFVNAMMMEVDDLVGGQLGVAVVGESVEEFRLDAVDFQAGQLHAVVLLPVAGDFAEIVFVDAMLTQFDEFGRG